MIRQLPNPNLNIELTAVSKGTKKYAINQHQLVVSHMKTPVLFIVFTRMDTTMKVFSQIRKYKPKKLYIASDGARTTHPNELKKVQEIRDYLVQTIDWDCDLKTLFQKDNLGCKYAPHNAITWFFENEENGIILEDDCLPSTSFFPYMEELLEKYHDDFRIFGISGINFNSHIVLEDSYYFSSYFFTWGWATWRSRWQKHLEILESFDAYINHPKISGLIDNKYVLSNLIKKATNSYEDKIDAWDYPWFLSCMINNGLIAVPNKNLIRNIGFGEDATHTTGNSHNERENEEIPFPFKHPIFFKPNEKMDNLFFENVLKWMSPWQKIRSLSYITFMSKAYKKGLLRRLKLL